jgi:hypothetical protein
MMRHGLGELIGAGGRAVSRYTGTLLAVFVTQALVAAAGMLAIAFVLAQAFARLPMFDEAVDGDLVALIYCLRWGKPSFLAVGGIVLAAVLLWQVVAWFVAGGIYGVLANRPEGRGATARCFGAAGATTYLAYARLAVFALPGWSLVLFVWGLGFGLVRRQLDQALTVAELLGPIALASLPALLLWHFFATVTDYARIELTLRGDSHAPGVLATYLRTLAYVARRPLALLHAGLGWFAWLLVTLLYLTLAQGSPMYGAGGAVMLFFLRQGVALLRLAIRFGVLAGQVELGRTRPLPPRRVELAVDAKG